MKNDDYDELLVKYKQRIKKEFGEVWKAEPKVSSKDYFDYKKELYPTKFSIYEKACNFSENLLKMKVDGKTAEQIQKNIEVCHLNVTPSGVMSFAIFLPLLVIVFGSLISFLVFQMMFFVIFFVIAGMLLVF